MSRRLYYIVFQVGNGCVGPERTGKNISSRIIFTDSIKSSDPYRHCNKTIVPIYDSGDNDFLFRYKTAGI